MTKQTKTPAGNEFSEKMLGLTSSDFAPNRAYFEGKNHYLTFGDENENPYDSKLNEHLHNEWKRAYRVARKHDRFAATIRKRQEGK